MSDFGSAVHCGHLEFLFSTFKIPKQKETRELSYFSLAGANVSVELSYFSFSFFFFFIFFFGVCKCSCEQEIYFTDFKSYL